MEKHVQEKVKTEETSKAQVSDHLIKGAGPCRVCGGIVLYIVDLKGQVRASCERCSE